MSHLPERRREESWISELSDTFNGFPSWGLRPLFTDSHLIRLEEDMKDGHYLVRAEIPGIDPAKDVDITVSDSRLTIKAERSERNQVNGRSEFSYGSFVRTIALPAGSNADDIKATYDKGILTVDVAVPKESVPAVKHVEVKAVQ
jgi:HSP20 family molecular chaperone IbpA